MRFTVVAMGLSAVALMGSGQSGGGAPVSASAYNDPVAYCRAAGTADRPARPYAGPTVPDWIYRALDRRSSDFGTVSWRCAGTIVLACADASNGAVDHCKQYSVAERTPGARLSAFCSRPGAEGQYPNPIDSVENYICLGGQPVRHSRGGWDLDDRGFRRDTWVRVTPALADSRPVPMDQRNFTRGERLCYEALRVALLANRGEGEINFDQHVCTPEAFQGTQGLYRTPGENVAPGEYCFQVFRNARLDHDAGRPFGDKEVSECDLGEVEEWWALNRQDAFAGEEQPAPPPSDTTLQRGAAPAGRSAGPSSPVQMRPVEHLYDGNGSNRVGIIPIVNQTVTIRETDAGYNFEFGQRSLASDIESYAVGFEYLPFFLPNGNEHSIIRFKLVNANCPSSYRVMFANSNNVAMSDAFPSCSELVDAFIDSDESLHVIMTDSSSSLPLEYIFGAYLVYGGMSVPSYGADRLEPPQTTAVAEPDESRGPVGDAARFLRFPLDCAKADDPCDQPYANGPFTPGMINAILDHSMRENPNTGNLLYGLPLGDGRDVITAFNGEQATGSIFDTNCLGGRIELRPAPGADPMTNASGCRNDPNFAAYDDHPGYDYRAALGAPVKAAATGHVLSIDGRRCYIGNMGGSCDDWGFVGIDHANGYVSQYGHLSRILVNAGDLVTQGQVIGYSGSTSSPEKPVGPHLHFEVWARVGGTYLLADPYGWTGTGQDPLYSALGSPPVSLWEVSSEGPDSDAVSANRAGQVFVTNFAAIQGYIYVRSVRSFVDENGNLNITAAITNNTGVGALAVNLFCLVETTAGRVYVDPMVGPDGQLHAIDLAFRANETRAVSFAVRTPGATGRVLECGFQE